MKKNCIRYIPICSDEGSELIFKSVIICDKKIPETPYFKIQIRVLHHEKSFSHNRPTPPWFKRFSKALRAAIDTFKNTLSGV